jgi:hypothetical protein
MIRDQEIYKICEGFEKIDTATAIKKLIAKGYIMAKATEYYNFWRKYYVITLFNID